MPEAESPEPSPPIWQRPERASRGPVPEHSRASIAAAGVALADAEGLAAVTMRRVATAIGAAPASLYRYVENRDELVALMADAATAELILSGLPSGAGWRRDILTVARQLRAVYLRHPWLLDIPPGRLGQSGLGPAAVDYLEGAVAALSELDVPARTKMEAVALLTGVVGLFAKDEAGGANASAQAQAANAAYLAAIVAAGKHPHLGAVMARAGSDQASERASEHAAEGASNPAELFERVVLGVMSGLLAPPSIP